MNTDTPRCNKYDEIIWDAEKLKHPIREYNGLLEFSRQLERELTAETEKVKMLRETLEKSVRYLADLNGCDWIKGDSVAGLDMKQRAKSLQSIVFSAISKAKGKS